GAAALRLQQLDRSDMGLEHPPPVGFARHPRRSSGFFGFFLGFTNSSGVCKRSSLVSFPSGLWTNSHGNSGQRVTPSPSSTALQRHWHTGQGYPSNSDSNPERKLPC